MTGAFPPDIGLAKQQEISLTIQEGMYTPLSMKTSDSFEVSITDENLNEINFVRQALSVTMRRGKDVGAN